MPDGSGHMQPYLDQALEGASNLVGSGVDWIDALRRAGADAYGTHGLPKRRDEYWRYTNLNALADEEFRLANGAPAIGLPSLPHKLVAELATYRVVVVNGRLRPDLCALDGLPDDVLVSGLEDLMAAAPARLEPYLGKIIRLDEMPMAALNTAFLRDGMAMFVGDRVVLDKPVHLISITAPGDRPLMVQPRHLVVLGKNASATLIETHITAEGGSSFNNIVAELQMDDGAKLNHFVFQEEAETSVHLSGTAVAMGADTTYDSFVLQSGGAIGRSEIHAYLNGTGGDCRLDGVYLASDKQVVDNTTFVEHAAPGCRSRQVYKGVLDGQSRGVFQGKVHVLRDAQQTDGHQLSRALLLSPRAEIDARPELEIYADDVKCSHGATAGELDDDSLFYLLSRGIPREDARRMLIEAFLSEAIAEIPLEQVAEDFTTHVRQWLANNVGSARGQD